MTICLLFKDMASYLHKKKKWFMFWSINTTYVKSSTVLLRDAGRLTNN